MTRHDLLFRDVLVPTATDYSQWATADLAVSDGVVAEIGPELSGSARFEELARRLVLLPGLFNLHTHSHDMFWRGAKDSRPINEVRPEWYWSAVAAMPPSRVAIGARLTYLANALCGVTYVVDHLRRDLPSAPFARALADVGLRGRVHTHCDEGADVPIALLHETSPGFELSLDQAACTPSRPIMIHAQETRLRLDHVLAQFGRSTVELLDERGLLHSQTFLVHLGEHSDHDLDLIRERGAHVVATPAAEMKLGERTFDAVVARDRGISLLLGTDGPAYDASEDIFFEMKMLSLSMSAKYGPGRLSPREILEMTTFRAAEAVAARSLCPSVGAAADFVLVDAHDIGVLPIVSEPFDNVAAQLVHGVTRSAVAFVCVGGVLVVKDGRSTLIDEGDVFRTFAVEARRYMTMH
jgi:5-methylthioadenosine/S-adenosylhomocysteine deaminase